MEVLLASHWATGSEGLPPALWLLAAVPYALLGVLAWLLLRRLRDGPDRGSRAGRRPRRHP